MEYLGQISVTPTDPDAFKLACVPNRHDAYHYAARFTIPEFTSLCPVTGQPDFATIVIDYVPQFHLVESKALKLYATSFRNVGDFHEACTNKIADKIFEAAKPLYLRVAGFWYPRGGIPIDVFVERGDKSIHDQLYIPKLDARDYRGR
jgi:7-cyano-7-deazaguanine reductase